MTQPHAEAVTPPLEDEAVSPAWSAVVAALVAVLGVAAVVGSLRLGFWTSIGPGPGFFPLWLGVILAGLSSVWWVRSVRDLRAARALPAETGRNDEGRGEDVAGGEEPFSWGTVGAILASLLVLASLLDVLGYQLAMLAFLVFHLAVLGRRGWLLTGVLSVAGSFGVFVVFTRLLTVNLPASSIPFLAELGL